MRTAWRLAGAAGAAAAAALLAASCGNVQAADLFVVTRTGGGAHPQLTLLVNEEGVVRCDGRRAGKLSDGQIVKARAITEDIEKPASGHMSLAARPGSVYSYRLRDASGTVAFADNSAGQPKALHELALFVLQTAQQVCGLTE